MRLSNHLNLIYSQGQKVVWACPGAFAACIGWKASQIPMQP